ncbi:isocitrate lyase/PEP mutase family protein [Piscinibacter koreensis]|uniref:Isocitrate lyase/PEP mutase family protein n=1 Tax=Piscinibacter koreensis TaxID=2742824 RepID=A0A7Y6NP46_9BURK|nr:isocitrate lyase/PEP mutase family protein [Schlegelella koreensis]NUZ06599.1 isocitrate lyase/PEP mutase family protein [Schlegelella koreensis]
MNQARRLRTLLQAPETVVAPGVYDAITARLVEQAGFPAAYMTGAGASAARGYPDYGLLTMSEMVGNAATIAAAIRIPLIADADTGYGNELNVTRTVREYEARGVAAIHVEDQVAPKRCGHLAGKELVSRDEFVSKIRAAVAARRDPDFLVIARTDARAVSGLDEAIARANAALAAGADMAFVEAPQTLDEVAAIPRRVNGPCLFNIVPGGKTPSLKTGDAEALGYRLVIVPGILLKTIVEACDDALAALRSTQLAPPGRPIGVHALFRRFGADEWDALRARVQAQNAAAEAT